MRELSTSTSSAGSSETVLCVFSRSSRSRRTESIICSTVQPGCEAVPSDSGLMSRSRSEAFRPCWGSIRDMNAGPVLSSASRAGRELMASLLPARPELAPLEQADLVLIAHERVLPDTQDRSALDTLPVGHAAQPDLVVGMFVRPGIE